MRWYRSTDHKAQWLDLALTIGREDLEERRWALSWMWVWCQCGVQWGSS